MADEVIIGDLLLAVDVQQTPDAVIDRALDSIQQRVGQRKITVDVSVGGGSAEVRQITEDLKRQAGEATRAAQATTDAQKQIDAMFQQSGASARASASAFRQAAQEQKDQAAAERQAAQEGLQRLRDRAATLQLNARLSAEAARKERDAMDESIRSLDALQRSTRNLWQAGQLNGVAVLDQQKEVQRRALAAADALDKESDAYRRLTQVAAAAQRTMDQATGRVTPGGFSAGIVAGIQNSGLFNQLAALSGAGGAAQNLGIIAQNFTTAKASALEFAGATNTAATAAGFLSASGAALGVALVSVVGGLSSAYNAAADFQDAMKKAGATTEATGAQLGQLGDLARSPDLVNLGVGGKAAAQGIEELGSQGLATAKILDGGLVSSLTLAKAVSTDVGTAAQVAAGSVKAFGLEGKELAHVTDIVTNAVNGTSIKIGDFGAALAAGGEVAKSSGVDFVQFTAAISFMTDKFLSARDAGTSFKSFLQALTPNSKAAAEEMDRLKFSAFDALGNFKPLSQIIEELRQKFARLTPEQRASTAETIFGSDGIRAFNILIEQGADGLENRIRQLDRMGTADKAAQDKLSGARGEQEKFNAALENFKSTVAEGFLPGATQMLKWSTDFLQNLTAINKELDKRNNGKAAFGAETYDLPTWLKNSGLRESDLTPDELKRARDLLGRMQAAANRGASNANQWRNLGNESAAQWVDRDTAQQIGRLGVQLTQIQRDVSLRPQRVGPELGTTASPTAVQIVGGKDLVTLLGMGGRTVLNEFGVSGADYHHDGAVRADAVHNGIDYKAERGAPILAPFTGTLTVRENATSGKIFELIDAAGNKLVGIHLDAFNKEVLAALKAGGGKAIIAAGSKIGTVGNTGATAGSTSHLHLMGYAAGSNTPINPTTIQFKPVTEGQATTAAAYGPREPVVPGPKPKSDQQLITEAKRILIRLEEATKKGDLTGKVAAEGVLKAFTDSSARAAAAVEVVRTQTRAADKAISQFGQGFDKLKGQLSTAEAMFKLNSQAQTYIRSLDAVSAAAKRAADTEKAKNGETAKYRALLDLSGDAASKARQQREAIQREQDQANRDADTAVKNRLKTQQDLQKALDTGREGDARRYLQSLKDQQAAALTLAKDDAARRAQIIEQTGPAILKAEDRLANLQRDQRVKAAQRAADEAKLLPGADLSAIERTRVAAVAEAYKDAAALRAKARQEQEQAETQADQRAADAAKRRAQEQAGLRARVADERRQQSIQAAQDDLARTQELGKQELDAFRGTAAERLKLIRRQAEDEYQARLAVARATQRQALAAAANGPAQYRQGAEDAANRAYTQAELSARGQRDAAVRQATEGVKQEAEAVSRLEERYRSLMTAFAGKALSGDLTDEDVTAYWQELNGLLDDAKKAGLDLNPAIVALRNASRDLAAEAPGMREWVKAFTEAQDIAARRYGDGQAATASVYRQSYGAGDEGLIRSLSAVTGKTIAQVRANVEGALDDAKKYAPEVAAIIERVWDDALAHRREVGAQERQDAADTRDFILSTLQNRTDEGLLRVYNDAVARKDQELIKAVFDEWERRGQEAERQHQVLLQMQSDANTALADGAKKTADELAQAGDSDGALATLEGALSRVMDAAARGEDAADAINTLTDAINDLTGTSALNDEFNTFIAGLSGTLADQIDQVVTKMEEVTDPALLARLRTFLADLRGRAAQAYTISPDVDAMIHPGDVKRPATGASGGAYTQASALLGRLEQETDPARLQGIMAEIGDFLASGIGQELPESVRKGLEDGVKNAQDYVKIVHDITANGVEQGTKDGRDRVRDAGPLPKNRFGDLLGEVTAAGQRGDLLDPEKLKGLTDGLNLARGAGELTAYQLDVLLKLVDQLTTDAGRFKQAQDDVTALEQSFRTGRISLEDFTGQAGALSDKLDRMGRAAEKARDPKLAAQYRDLAVILRNLIPVLDGTESKLERINRYADYVSQLGQAFGQVGSALGGDLGANLAGFGKALGTVAGITQDLVSGNYLGAAIKLFVSLADALGGYQKANREAAEKQKQFNEQFTFLNGDDYAKTFTRSRGFFADFFGGGPEVVQEVDKLGLQFAKTLEGSAVDGIKNGLKAAIAQNDFGAFSKTLHESVYDGVLNGIIDAFVNQELLKNILGPAIKAWSDALKTPDPSDDVAALAGIDAAISQVDAAASRFYSDVAPKLADLQNKWGLNPDGSANTAQNGSLFGAAPGAQLGIPRVEVTLPDSLTRPLSEFATAVPVFARASDTLLQAAQMLLRGGGAGSASTPPPLSGLGALTGR